VCEVCSGDIEVEVIGRRRKIWEVTGGWHCSVVGTCLTLLDLRTLARKLSVKTKPDYSRDYQLHGFFAQEAGIYDKPGKLLNKLLDKRHAGAIRKTRSLKCENKLRNFWNSALEMGDIPGPYWAILSHPYATQKLSESMFADVHMLSHLVGSSNRADIRRLQELNEGNSELSAKILKQQRHHSQRINAKDVEITNLREKLGLLAAMLKDTPDRTSTQQLETSSSVLLQEIEHLRKQKASSRPIVMNLQHQNDQLTNLVQSLHIENATLERTLQGSAATDDTECPFDLEGRCLLYVGGRISTVHRLKALVEEWNGHFIHHDGGLERSIDELARAILKVDAVIFPTDCVSHNAANKIKSLCQQTMKPFIPLRSSGIASFVSGVRNRFEGIDIAQKLTQ
jgi:hypothetical protein